MTQMTADTNLITASVELACRAPSLHNSQPWRWVVCDASVDLFVDPHRTVTSTDESGREAIISCGAALDHLRVAMAAVGWNTNVGRFPNPNDPDHLASIDVVPTDYVAQARRDLADAILRRRTNRLPFRGPKHWSSLEPVLRDALENGFVDLDVLGADARSRLAEAARLNEALRRYDDRYHHELEWWTSPLRKYEGIPESALVSELDDRRVEVNRRFPIDPLEERSSAGTYDDAKILVLSTLGDTRVDALRCGEALSRILLECTVSGLSTCPVTHITELEATREMIRDLTGRPALPQVLIRVGIEPEGELPPDPTPRRPLSDVVQIRR
ncbi:Acg family FMN-binding oxidoreductase [Mycobacterium intracellulare]|uniref:Acg n=1 Tax=Mycobacterium intracellulare subsp. chimaera TaxID=222805 RepID=A0A7U5MKH1_MYCIT|nr:NAD(P)H nitroreductase [Mycobacterium intracellulare]ASL15155.1 Acg [Mycobacterium intracellulare subsp. chimaera]ASQ86339.1 NAD(P)H nitroreductase [Mycobacterium intracellulare subsp. chimaera]MCF1811681.1 NAD(P)H nitroreductase [Mycobacterium intracellulare subsp. intracellulare]MDM3929467.1 NAD(P)H nitroreductase [Mycobacterium intracellulare subsp. chimaera]MDS0333208.1 NAD(P)H nitroreductase [Mycobacterium intracellulare]